MKKWSIISHIPLEAVSSCIPLWTLIDTYRKREREKKKVISLGRLWFFSIIILCSFPSFFPWHISTHGGFFFWVEKGQSWWIINTTGNLWGPPELSGWFHLLNTHTYIARQRGDCELTWFWKENVLFVPPPKTFFYTHRFGIEMRRGKRKTKWYSRRDLARSATSTAAISFDDHIPPTTLPHAAISLRQWRKISLTIIEESVQVLSRQHWLVGLLLLNTWGI